MDHWVKQKHRHGSENPSFSSTLLDAIYRSLDEEEELVLYKETSKKKQSTTTTTAMRSSTNKLTKEEEEDEMESFRRACMIEKWMEKKVSEKVVFRRNSLPDFDRKTLQNEPSSSKVFHSTSSSSDSSCGGVFSSSEAESCYGSRSRASSFTCQRPKPIRTNVYEDKDRISNSNMYEQQQKQGNGGGFNKTKSKAMKIYGELKKAKQPISPGGRLASFLNNLFTSGHVKKSKISNSTTMNSVEERKSKSEQTSTCSSASSFSRSCLSKTPSTRSKPTMNGNGTVKRSVRFYPVSVIVDEDSRPCGHKSLLQEGETPKIIKLNDQLKFHIMEKNRRIEEAARDLLKNYQRKNDAEMRDRDDDSDDDAASDASSDLFELDNLQRYREELPVYETTHLEKNRAIANGFFV